jgi:hypothetical protein
MSDWTSIVWKKVQLEKTVSGQKLTPDAKLFPGNHLKSSVPSLSLSHPDLAPNFPNSQQQLSDTTSPLASIVRNLTHFPGVIVLFFLWA